jgi:two-component system, NtrC family, sensor histidine kinase HydH
VRQALLNLVGNALEVTPAGGSVSVTVARRGGDVAFEIADTGPGVAPELRERIFEPFFTTREQGTGLGLAVVERVALSHGGAVELADGPSGGALFRLVLPDATETNKW